MKRVINYLKPWWAQGVFVLYGAIFGVIVGASGLGLMWLAVVFVVNIALAETTVLVVEKKTNLRRKF